VSDDLAGEQAELANRFSVEPWPSRPDEMAGVARNVRGNAVPLNGLRHPPENGTCGWYIWAGEEFSSAADFFLPVHVSHLEEWCPLAMPYLALPPGWRFLIAPGHEDVWFDETLLAT